MFFEEPDPAGRSGLLPVGASPAQIGFLFGKKTSVPMKRVARDARWSEWSEEESRLYVGPSITRWARNVKGRTER